jgi:phosphopantothenoylcysteine decarboxylase/phosphopantothenate--cysteine ligase
MHFLITAGGTREYIDPVRFISNASSGRMGYALAAAAIGAGHKVTLISASDLQPPVGMEFVGVDSAAEMFAAVKKFFAKCDCLIMAAAVADYTPVWPAKAKIKRTSKPINIRLKPTPDILRWAGEHKEVKSKKAKGKIVVGFALEDSNLRRNAERKLKEKNLDMVVANTPAAIGGARCRLWVKWTDSKWRRMAAMSKRTAAARLIRMIEQSSQAD